VPILVVGTVAFDSVATPSGTREEILGGSATHFSAAASFFAPVRLVAVVGGDFGQQHREPLLRRGVDLSGLQVDEGRTFRWAGEYGADLNNPTTLDTQLNVLAGFNPKIPAPWVGTPVLFLANIDPDLQSRVLDAAGSPRIIAADTMNYWIDSKAASLRRLIRRVHILFINEAEIRQLTGERGVVDAAHHMLSEGPSVVVVKRGEYGVAVFSGDEVFALPAFPLRLVVDPTGAGDAFAGGFLGFLATQGSLETAALRRAAVAGSVMASFQVEDFSLERLLRLDLHAIRERFEAFRRLVEFGDFPL
jgi:sugar/nucleoside kinase (ribokinase family)